MFFVKLPQIRHPERSASLIDCVTLRSVARSRRTSAVLILPMLLGAFRPPKPDIRTCCDTHWMVTYIFSCAVIIFHPQVCASSLNSGIDGANEVELFWPPGAGSVVEKLRAAWVK
jgi:hypothetical protein